MRFPTILRYGVVIFLCLLSRKIENKGLFAHPVETF